MITIESREPKKIQAYFIAHNIPYSVSFFTPGDYIIHEYIIERKTWSDFFASYSHGRLIKQCSALSHYTSYLVLEEFPLYAVQKKELFYKLLVIIQLHYKIRIMFTENLSHTAAFLIALSQNKYTKMKPTQIRTYTEKSTLEERKMALLQCIPSIGKEKAKKIMKHYPSLRSLFTSSKEELISIGLGQKTRREIKRMFD
jgi:DNA excision repair protein ERCC-4